MRDTSEQPGKLCPENQGGLQFYHPRGVGRDTIEHPGKLCPENQGGLQFYHPRGGGRGKKHLLPLSSSFQWMSGLQP